MPCPMPAAAPQHPLHVMHRAPRRYDKPLCERGVTNCSAPLFTFDKRWNATAYAAGLPGSAHDDVLHPVMNHPFEVCLYACV